MQEVSSLQLNEYAGKLLSLFKERGLTFGTAESCTGGLISKTITDLSGASSVYLGSVVSYANEVKERVLGVKRETLESVGAVSYETASQMSEGARRVLGVDFAVSVTGIAGPGGGTDEKPVGLVYICASCGERSVVEKNIFTGSRDEIRIKSACRALEMTVLLAEEIYG